MSHLQLKIDTGAVDIDIVDKNGETIGTFRFNPNDLDITKRFNQVTEHLDKIEISDGADINEVMAVSDKLREEMDFLLNYPVSSELFKKCNPMSFTSDGDLYIEKVIEGIAGLIESVTNERVEKKRAKIRRATEKYTSKAERR